MSGDKIRVLVIDDDAELTASVAVVLETNGYETLTAHSGGEGLEIAYTQHPHLILLDVTLPDMDGVQLCRELQFGYTKDIPVVFLTARAQLSDMIQANRSGAAAFLTKPFRADHLLHTIRDVLRDTSVYLDEITGLPTLANVQVEVQRTLVERSQLGILYITVDGVHTLERVQGFEVVDEILRVIGQRLTEARGQLLRDEDFVSISSLGNAFLVILSPPRSQGLMDEDDLLAVKLRLEQQLLERLEQDLASMLFATIDLHVGYARLSQSPKVRFKRALLAAIEGAMHGIEKERNENKHRLRDQFTEVIDKQQITCVYQPIVALGDYSVLGYELLARGPTHSELHRPDTLFEVARAEARVHELDRVCRLAATRGAATLPEEYLRFINTEPVNLFFHARSNALVQEFVDATPAHLRRLTVMEITENSVIEDFSRMREVIRRLRSEGFRIAVDDAGAGYAGLQTLVEIEPDFIKLDMSLTRNLETSIVKQMLVATLRDFCREAGITLIAEGIETQTQYDALVELGVGFGQGFFFAYPAAPYPLQEEIRQGQGRAQADLARPATHR
jgi:EAL domain-containing protein (putative c-di-GMP-specific phosphodiesterase class I)/DNA-binding response OmpR family regulator